MCVASGVLSRGAPILVGRRRELWPFFAPCRWRYDVAAYIASNFTHVTATTKPFKQIFSLRSGRSIRFAMVSLVMGLTVPMGLLFAWYLSSEEQVASEFAFAQVELVAKNVKFALQARIDSYQQQIKIFAAEGELALNPKAKNFDAEQYLRLHPAVLAIGARDTSGSLKYSAPKQVFTQSDWDNIPWTKNFPLPDGVMVSDAYWSTALQRWIIVMSAPVHDLQKKEAGRIYILLDLLTLGNESLAAVPANFVVPVFDVNYQFLMRSKDPEAWVGKPLPAVNLALVKDRPDSTFFAIDLKGFKRLYAIETLPQGWRVAAGVLEDEVLGPMRSRRTASMALGLGTLLLLLSFAWWRAGSIANPVRRLATDVDRMRVNDLVHAELQGPIEVQQVAQQLNVQQDERMQRDQELVTQLQRLRELNTKYEDAQNQLLQSEKMATIGQLAAGVAHEINNPIAFVQSNLGTLTHYLDDLLVVLDHAQQCIDSGDLAAAKVSLAALMVKHDIAFLRGDISALLAESKEGTDRVRRIVNDLRDFSRVGEVDWIWANVHQGLDSTLNIVGNQIKYKVEVEKHYGELPEIRCIPSQLNQVFLNLLVNAEQAIESTGKITIATGVGDDAEHIWIEFSDTGSGITEANQKHIFEPFYTTKPVGKGTGLGLSLSWGIIKKHHGTITVTSALGAGTTFRIVLPVQGQGANA